MGGILVKARNRIKNHTSGSTGGGPDVLRFLSGVYIPRSRRLRGGYHCRGAVYMPHGMDIRDIRAVFLATSSHGRRWRRGIVLREHGTRTVAYLSGWLLALI